MSTACVLPTSCASVRRLEISLDPPSADDGMFEDDGEDEDEDEIEEEEA